MTGTNAQINTATSDAASKTMLRALRSDAFLIMTVRAIPSTSPTNTFETIAVVRLPCLPTNRKNINQAAQGTTTNLNAAPGFEKTWRHTSPAPTSADGRLKIAQIAKSATRNSIT